METDPKIKITVIGDGLVGKTCMLSTYSEGKFPKEYVPTVFDNCVASVNVDGENHNVTLCDTAGQEGFERLRTLSYTGTCCLLVCFSVEKQMESYINVILKWAPEARRLLPHAPVILVATKTDLRDDPSYLCYTPKEGEKLRRKVKAHSYKECSAMNNEGIEEIFIEAVRIYLKTRNTKRRAPTCLLL